MSAIPNPITQPLALRRREGPDNVGACSDNWFEEDDGGPDDVEASFDDWFEDDDGGPDDVEESFDDWFEDDDGGPDDVEDGPEGVDGIDDGGPDDAEEDDDGGPDEKTDPIAAGESFTGKGPGQPRLVVFVPMEGPVEDLAQRVNRIIRAMAPAGDSGPQTSNAAKTTKTMRVFAIFTDPDLDKATRHERALQAFQDTKNPEASLCSCLSYLKHKGLKF